MSENNSTVSIKKVTPAFAFALLCWPYIACWFTKSHSTKVRNASFVWASLNLIGYALIFSSSSKRPIEAVRDPYKFEWTFSDTVLQVATVQMMAKLDQVLESGNSVAVYEFTKQNYEHPSIRCHANACIELKYLFKLLQKHLEDHKGLTPAILSEIKTQRRKVWQLLAPFMESETFRITRLKNFQKSGNTLAIPVEPRTSESCKELGDALYTAHGTGEVFFHKVGTALAQIPAASSDVSKIVCHYKQVDKITYAYMGEAISKNLKGDGK